MTPPLDHVHTQARAARADVEAALDRNGWRWNLGLSRWLDVLITIEDGDDR
jgi:hypothetical protein